MDEELQAQGIRGLLHRPESWNGDAIALTHGAGSNSHTPLLVGLANALSDRGYLVLRYDLPFRVERPKGGPFPGVGVRDRQGIVLAMTVLRSMTRGHIIAGGHSYGGRQTTMAAAEHAGIADALLLLAYPLRPPKRPDQIRTAHFPQLRTPSLFVHGTSDPFGSVAEVREALELIPARTDLLAVEGTGHDLKRAADLSAEIVTRLRALL
ncbi:MAG TPA: alpha/beta family hydrolase [Bryobacteraceae bacterium]|nr:alpha/beta family hydrolase [Bryobacteraceae bacterium]